MEASEESQTDCSTIRPWLTWNSRGIHPPLPSQVQNQMGAPKQPPLQEDFGEELVSSRNCSLSPIQCIKS